jgi:LuxR family transcriptional regulator, maltose regulon positive regulatory protein
MPNHSGRAGARRGSPLLGAKLRAATVPDQHIRRDRLLRLLDATTTAPVALINAPAGAGKTTLAASWVAESPSPTAWLAIDETDRDAGQFWTAVIAALQAFVAGCGESSAISRRRRPSLREVVDDLLDDLDAADRQASYLVIDDVQIVDDADEISTSLARFLEHLPSWLHVVLLSRRDLTLAQDRMRARGQLGEVHFAELRFSDDEARQLLTRLASSLSPETVDAAVASAAGWAAGLQLTALAVRSSGAQHSPDDIVRGEDLLVHDYVWREVLGGEAPELVEAMLNCAVVERVNTSLAQALTLRSDADALLLRAEARGLFVTRVGTGGWFEVHALARAALKAELGNRAPSRLAEQHARAAKWFEGAGEVPLALEHWLLAGRSRDALRVLAATAADLYENGREATLQRTMADLAPDVVTADLDTMIEYTWCHLLVDRRRFLELVELLTFWTNRSTADKTTRARVMILESIAAAVSGGSVASGQLARRAMDELGDDTWRDPLCRFGWNMVARDIALSERWDDGSDEVCDARFALGRDPRRRIAFEETRALGQALAGRPVDALGTAAAARRAATVSNMTIVSGELALAEAIAHREIGDRARAVPELDALAQAPGETTLFAKILANCELAHASVDNGDLDRARLAVAAAERLVDAESFGPDGHSWVSRAGIHLALTAGRLDDARRFAESDPDSFWAAIHAARVELTEGEQAKAAAVLATAVPRCVRHEVIVGLLKARCTDDHDESLKLATVAVEQAAQAGILQTVASEGADILELVERAAWRVPSPWLERLRRTAASSRLHVRVPKLIDPLTERERDVLRFLPSRLTIREIADELFVSVNTLKFHLKVIYRKLGVSSRAEAAELARRMSHLA